MEFDLTIPQQVPVMTLRETVFFPQAILPLYIFEERYRAMLTDVLSGNRLFAIACQSDCPGELAAEIEPPYCLATLGMVRAAHENPDGTSNLVLQGVSRIRIRKILREEPYRLVEIEPQPTEPGAEAKVLRQMKRKIVQMLQQDPSLAGDVPEEFVKFLMTLREPDLFADLSAAALCQCVSTKQRLLETVRTDQRLHLLYTYLNFVRQRQELYRVLQGQTPDELIDLN